MAEPQVTINSDDVVDTRTGLPLPEPEELSTLSKLRKELGTPFKQAAEFIGAVTAPVPDETGDGSKLPPDEHHAVKKVEADLRDMTHLRISDVKTLMKVMYEKVSGAPVDDKTYLMEGIISTAAKLPDGSKNRDTLTHQFLTQLWNDLEHPPKSYLGAKYQYRSADGSFNSLVHPQLGAAGTPYARTVKPSTIQTPARPDPGVIFDSVMVRKHRELHPNRISSVLFYLASIIIHDCFKTDHRDYANSMTSSYLDLSPLYGSNQAEQDLMRTHENGMLKPDSFSEARLLFFPPGVGVLLIMFNRFHNHVVENLAAINEGNRFPRPTPPADSKDEEAQKAYQAKLKKFDEDLFQTGRLITCGLYCNIILVDYVRTILNLNYTDSNWQLNPRAEMRDAPVATGNQVSAEFNLVYRWHSTLSDRDEQWTEEMWDGLFGKGPDGKRRDPKTVHKYEFLGKLDEVYKKMEKDPAKRKFANLERNADGTLPDEALVDIITSSVEDCANSFGPNRVPAIMRAIEVLGIEQSRAWNLGTLNEFRKYFKLEPHRTFEDITSDPYVAEQLKHLYDHPDKVEIYPGIVVEDAKKAMIPASGLCPPYTVSRAVLSDAVALVRGDRFYTIDYNPRTLTNWGYKLVDKDDSVNNGGVFYKLFLRAFPKHLSHDSIYAHYPLTIPSAMKDSLTTLNKAHLYNFDKPSSKQKEHSVFTYKTAISVMKDNETFKVGWAKNMEYLMGPHARDFMLAGDGPKNHISRTMMHKAIYVPPWEAEVKSYYAAKTRELLAEKGAQIADFHQVDVVRDVGNKAHLHFAAEMFMLPLKTEERPHGVFTEAELYLIMASVFALIFFDVDPVGSFPLHVKAHAATQMLGKMVQANVEAIASSGVVSHAVKAIWPNESPLRSYGIHLIQRLLDTGMEPERLVWGHLLGTAGGMVSNQGALFAQVVEFFLLDEAEGKKHWPEVVKLAARPDDDDEAFNKLMKYMLEASRLCGATGVVREVAADTTLQDGKRTLELKKGDRVLVNLLNASRDPDAFPNPDVVDLNRPLDGYIHHGAGPHECIGLPMSRVAMTTMLREVARLKNLRPAKGPQGRVHKVARKPAEGQRVPFQAYLTESWDGFWPFPCCKLSRLQSRLCDKGVRLTRLQP